MYVQTHSYTRGRLCNANVESRPHDFRFRRNGHYNERLTWIRSVCMYVRFYQYKRTYRFCISSVWGGAWVALNFVLHTKSHKVTFPLMWIKLNCFERMTGDNRFSYCNFSFIIPSIQLLLLLKWSLTLRYVSSVAVSISTTLNTHLVSIHVTMRIFPQRRKHPQSGQVNCSPFSLFSRPSRSLAGCPRS